MGADLFQVRGQVFETIVSGQPLRPLVMRLLRDTLVCMAFYGFLAGLHVGGRQVLFNTVKFPMILLATLLLSAAVLFVCAALEGSGLDFFQTSLPAMCGIAATALLLASLAPILWFMTASLDSDRHVAAALHCLSFGISGVCGWGFAMQAARHVCSDRPGVLRLFQGWLVVYGATGAQLAWFLRPYFYASESFLSLRPMDGNVFLQLWRIVTGPFSF